MRGEHAFGQASGLKEREAQKDCVSHNAPDTSDDVIRKGDCLDQHRIDGDADHDQEALEAEGKQGPQIVLADLALFAVPEGRKGDRCQAHHEIDLDHTSVHDDKDKDREDHGTELHHEGLQEQTEKRSQFHGFQGIPDIVELGSVDCGAPADESCAGVDHMLRDIKDRHRDIEGVGDQHDCHEGLEYPFEEYPGFKVCQVVVIDDQLDQLIAGDER